VTSLVLYDFESDENCYKVRLFLGALGLEHRKVPVNMVPGGEHKKSPLIDMNPTATLPILADGCVVLYGAEAILLYLAKRYAPAANWLPSDPAVYGQVALWLYFAAVQLEPASKARRISMFDEPGNEKPAERDARAAFRIMDDHMTVREFDGLFWFADNAPTIADIALFPAIALSRDIGIDHEAYPALRRWMRKVRTLPGFITMPGIPDYH
jgi:glutathione S-transferase